MPTGADGETLAEATPPPAPPPPPPPPAPATASSSPASTHRQRHRTFSSSSSSSSSLSTVSSAASSPSPSPRGRGTATTTTTTSVPFSWEHHPGIPKSTHLPGGTPSSTTAATPLPLPPPLRTPTTTTSRPRHHHHHARRRRATGNKPRPSDNHTADPFAAALAECTRPERGGAGSDAGLMDALFPARRAPPPMPSATTSSRRWPSAGGVVGLLDLYGCKSAMGGVAEAAFVVRRPVVAVVGRARAGRR